MSPIPRIHDASGQPLVPHIAIKEICAWPNLTLCPDGTVVATIHNQPSHLKLPSNVDCYGWRLGDSAWSYLGTPGPRDHDKEARGNVAAGLNQEGELVVIVSGWTDPEGETRGTILAPLVSHSKDGGRTWEVSREGFPLPWPEGAKRDYSPYGYQVPFGDILTADDGSLCVAMYTGNPGGSHVYRSYDGGRTWRDPAVLSMDHVTNEPAIFHLGGGRWIAANRFDGLDLYRSDDDARTWKRIGGLTGTKEHPGHVTRLADGRILLTYGNRTDRGVDIRLSEDEGESWSDPARLLDFSGDGGYPSSVQLADGSVLTAYYARTVPIHDGYHMGTVLWKP